MRQCRGCEQIVAEQITTCPVCGSPLSPGISGVDDYRLEKVLHEGRSAFVFRARKKGHETPVTIRLFTDESGVDEAIAARLDQELKVLAKLPPERFVQHFTIRRSREGLWYRVSEWVDADNWGRLLVSGRLNDQRRMVTLFYNIASALDLLHSHGHIMPFLILDDILLPRTEGRNLSVKINFKLSRFLTPKASHHGPKLKKLLAIHPDMVNQRAVDARTGIWSLGKLFVEMLTADLNLTRFSSRLDDIQGLDPELAVLIRVMLSDDPDLRPQSMAGVAAALEKLLERIPSKPIFLAEKKSGPAEKKPRQRMKQAAAVVLILAAAWAGLFVAFRPSPEMGEAALSRFIEDHSRSIGFLMVEYWLKAGDEVIYEKKVEGTAFLADRDGYILTNRHVACPWLEDPSLFLARFREKERTVSLGHRMFLWFEGDRAFNRLPGLEESAELADAYQLSNAYRSGEKGDLRIAGVPKGQGAPARNLHAQFSNDFAVLKIDSLPQGALPLPLEDDQLPEAIDRLSPVIIIGFPLGSRTQDERINASLTRGHVRRTSRDLIQVDSSIYKGNSGGPAVSSRGKVIGIASGVITEQPMNQLPLYTPLSDFGLVLPIAAPSRFIASLKSGDPKWNGLLDFSLEQKIEEIMDLAVEEKFDEAAALANGFLASSREPGLIFTAGLLDFCRNDPTSARERFSQLISIEGENTGARLLLYTMDWLEGKKKGSPLARPLFTMDWRHPDAFTGYLARVLAKSLPMDPEVADYENPAEKNWRRFMAGLILERQQPRQAAEAFRQVILAAGASDQLFLMALARLKQIRKALPEKEALSAQHRIFHEKALAARKKAKEAYEKSVAQIKIFESPNSTPEQKRDAAARLLELSPANRTIFARMAFFHAGRNEWDKARNFIKDYFRTTGRETRLSLGLGLLEAQIPSVPGNGTGTAARLAAFRNRIENPWYKLVAEQLIADTPLDKKEGKLFRRAAGSPARRLVLHTAMGLAAEGEMDRDRAARHYREAMGTYLDAWYEYELARNRLLGLRKSPPL